jgi:bacterioferritin-associated ferredoxin
LTDHSDELDNNPVVDRCVCRDIPFAELIRLHKDEGLDLNAIAARTGATAQCSMCRPYVRLALATGRPALPVLHETTIERILHEMEKRPGQ